MLLTFLHKTFFLIIYLWKSILLYFLCQNSDHVCYLKSYFSSANDIWQRVEGISIVTVGRKCDKQQLILSLKCGLFNS